MSASNLTEEEIRAILAGTGEDDAVVKKAKFLPLKEVSPASEPLAMEFLGDINVELSVELGRTTKTVRDILNLKTGAALSVNRVAGEHVDVYVNDIHLASGEVVVINEVLGVRISKLSDAGTQS